METIGSKRSYALTWCMPNNNDDDDDDVIYVFIIVYYYAKMAADKNMYIKYT